MSLSYQVKCDECGKTETSDVLAAKNVLAHFRDHGWFIQHPTGHALCPPHHRAEQANADLGPGYPTHYLMPGEHR